MNRVGRLAWPSPKTTKHIVCTVAALGSWALLVWLVVRRILLWHAIDHGMRPDLDSEAVRMASTLFFDKMTALAQASVALLGALWAFLSLADTKVKVTKDKCSLALFAAANAWFLASLIAYHQGYDFLVLRIFQWSAFDIRAPIVGFWRDSQLLCFAGGCVVLALTVAFSLEEGSVRTIAEE